MSISEIIAQINSDRWPELKREHLFALCNEIKRLQRHNDRLLAELARRDTSKAIALAKEE